MFRAKPLFVFAFITPMIAACSYFSDTPEREVKATRPTTQLASECARLQPLFGPSDEELSRDGMDAALKASMAKYDSDKNGELSYSEIQPVNDDLRAMNVGAAPVRDWNGDGVVNYQEFASGWKTMFDLCDRNRSQTVSWRELGFSPNVTAPRTEPSAPKKPKTDEGASERPRAGY